MSGYCSGVLSNGMRALLVLSILAAFSHAQEARAPRWAKTAALQERVDGVVHKGVQHLLEVQHQDGHWSYDGVGDPQRATRPAGFVPIEDLGKKRALAAGKIVGPADGGYTALALYALASCGLDRRRNEVLLALTWMQNHESHFDHRSDFGVYALSLRLLALAKLDPRHFGPEIRAYATTLALAQKDTGMWSYKLHRANSSTPAGAGSRHRADNSNTHFAVLALWAAYSLAEWKPATPVWRRLAAHYRKSAQRLGWGYRPDSRPTSTMTAAGLVGYVYACAALDKSPIALQRARSSSTIQTGFAAFRSHLKRTDGNRYFLASVMERVATVLAVRDPSWYETGATRLCNDQEKRGSWGKRVGSTDVYGTSLALVFLSRATFPPRKGKTTPESPVDGISPDERVAELKTAKTHLRAFEIYLVLSAQERVEERATLKARGDTMFEYLLGVMTNDRRPEARVTAAVLVRRWLGKSLLYDPNAPPEDRAVMTRAIRSVWRRAGG